MKLFSQRIMRYAKNNWIAVLLFGIATVLTHLDGNAAMMIGLVVGFYAFGLLLVAVIRLVSWLAKPNSEKSARLKKMTIRFIYAASLCAISWQGIGFIHQRLDAHFQPLIDKIEAYKIEYGEYPQNTLKVTNQYPAEHLMDFDKFSGNSLGYPFCDYTRSKEDGHYCINCMTYGFNHHSYCSGSSKWRNWD